MALRHEGSGSSLKASEKNGALEKGCSFLFGSTNMDRMVQAALTAFKQNVEKIVHTLAYQVMIQDG